MSKIFLIFVLSISASQTISAGGNCVFAEERALHAYLTDGQVTTLLARRPAAKSAKNLFFAGKIILPSTATSGMDIYDIYLRHKINIALR